jgi:hypothetical protein
MYLDACLFCHVAGNAGLAAAIAAFYQAKQFANSATVGLWDASFADIAALGSLLAMARCEGPHVRIHPPCQTATHDCSIQHQLLQHCLESESVQCKLIMLFGTRKYINDVHACWLCADLPR